VFLNPPLCGSSDSDNPFLPSDSRYIDPVLPLSKYNWLEAYCRLLMHDAAGGVFRSDSYLGCEALGGGRLSGSKAGIEGNARIMISHNSLGGGNTVAGSTLVGASEGEVVVGCVVVTAQRLIGFNTTSAAKAQDAEVRYTDVAHLVPTALVHRQSHAFTVTQL
jgi:hypothetical protein